MNQEKLIEQAKKHLENSKYSNKTKRIYLSRIKQYLNFFEQDKKHKKFDNESVDFYFRYIEKDCNYARSTKSQVYNSVMFFYKEVLGIDLYGEVGDFIPKRINPLPKALQYKDIKKVLTAIRGDKKLVVELICARGLKSAEVLLLRIKDIDLENNKIKVTNTETKITRNISIPKDLKEKIKDQIEYARLIFEKDAMDISQNQIKKVSISSELQDNGYTAKSFDDYFLFTSKQIISDKKNNIRIRSHFNRSMVARNIQEAKKLCNIKSEVNSNTLRNTYIFFLMENGYSSKMISEMLGFQDERSLKPYERAFKKLAL